MLCHVTRSLFYLQEGKLWPLSTTELTLVRHMITQRYDLSRLDYTREARSNGSSLFFPYSNKNPFTPILWCLDSENSLKMRAGVARSPLFTGDCFLASKQHSDRLVHTPCSERCRHSKVGQGNKSVCW